ncbi:aquaporin-like protein [Pleomassaria siparia CBS 279.74]|uniref:Aquaporin-like protein n=1 Tax=Pleomassaria siparia CBS 279.74 TaxID=1314801 RepID=A0A6G1KAD2_9PLEO|nr:aquaporin-like protein [Pleomassaria siparia CBS 279.74]
MVLPGMKPSYTTDPHRPGEKRLPGCTWLPNRVRHLLVSMLGEFVGTYLFLFFAFAGTQVANTPPGKAHSPPNVATLLYISLAFGFSLLVNVWIFFRISGGLFNPAVSVALALVGAIGWFKAALLIISQILAGISAAGVVSFLFPGPLTVRTSLNSNTSVVRGLFIETFLTAELIFCIFMLAAEKHKATFVAPVGIGMALFIAELAGVYFTGGSLNPARSFGPDVILRTFDSYHWIYWLGPLLGAVVAVVFYRLIKLLEYETANPGADSDGRELFPAPVSGHDGDTRHASRRTDGTNDSESLPHFHPIHKSLALPNTSGRRTAPSPGTGHYSIPNQPLPAYQLGGDGHHSRVSIDHPNERPRASHRRSSLSSHSHHTSDQDSYHSGPSIESGSAGYRSSSSSRSSS